MISYVVCLYRPEVFRYMAGPSLLRQRHLYGAEVIVERDEDSIFAAYERGRKRAHYSTVVYLHDDVALLDFDASVRIHEQMNAADAKLMGVIGVQPPGAGLARVPWWDSPGKLGGWARINCNQWDPERWKCRPVWQRGAGDRFESEAYTGQRPVTEPTDVVLLDGIFLADRSDLPWSERDGWHGYDADRCLSVADDGGRVVVGDVAIAHHNQPKDEPIADELDAAHEWLADKWGITWKEGP